METNLYQSAIHNVKKREIKEIIDGKIMGRCIYRVSHGSFGSLTTSIADEYVKSINHESRNPIVSALQSVILQKPYFRHLPDKYSQTMSEFGLELAPAYA